MVEPRQRCRRATTWYVRDELTPRSALTNTQTENQDPFIAGQLGMMISHPSEYAVMLDKAKRATGEDRKVAEAVVANIRYGLIPKGPVRRAVVFGGGTSTSSIRTSSAVGWTWTLRWRWRRS